MRGLAAGLLVMVFSCAPPAADSGKNDQHESGSGDERPVDAIEVSRDLVLGTRDDDPNELFFNVLGIAVDDEGAIYVLDAGNYRVQVFDSDGQFLRSFGREGEGPGEFGDPHRIAMVGGRVVVADRRGRRLMVWTRRGEHVATYRYPGNRPNRMAGFDDLLVFSFEVPLGAIDRGERIMGLTLPGGTLREYAELARGGMITLRPEAPVPANLVSAYNQGRADGTERGRPRFAVSHAGTIYFTSTGDYEVTAVDPSGDVVGIIRRDRRPREFPDEEVEEYLRHRRNWNVTRAHVAYPEHLPAIHDIRVDGAGNLVVYLFVYFKPREEPPAVWPVDVFSPAGDLVFSGKIPVPPWSAASGDFVYVIEREPESGDDIVVRYQLVTPWG